MTTPTPTHTRAVDLLREVLSGKTNRSEIERYVGLFDEWNRGPNTHRWLNYETEGGDTLYLRVWFERAGDARWSVSLLPAPENGEIGGSDFRVLAKGKSYSEASCREMALGFARSYEKGDSLRCKGSP